VSDHNFERLKSFILQRSFAPEWEVARKEWTLRDVFQAETPDTCPCGHTPIMEICVIKNRITGAVAEVGNVCVKRFLGFRSDLIFTGIKRVRADSYASLNADSASFFYDRGVLNDWEYRFTTNTMRKRVLSGKQADKRFQINQKVLRFISSRGVNPSEGGRHV
jgi:hypothetical protein